MFQKPIIRLILSVLLASPGFVLAETEDLQDAVNQTEEGQTTTIKIEKSRGKKAKQEAAWELTDGSVDLSSEPGATDKEAESNFRTSCKSWQKEFRADNKENKIISLNCGKPSCGGNVGNKVCTSSATYKIKTRVD